jgi:SAM-dependent methyltransferase
MVSPEHVRVEQTLAFLAPALAERLRILEVGCGRGTVARRLGASGFQVTAIDVELRDPTPAPNVTFVETDFLRADPRIAGPFDAVVFTASLHHISPLRAAIARTAELLVPRGLLVADDFDLEVPDLETLRWYYELRDMLAAAGMFEAAHHDHDHHHHHGHHAPSSNVVERWRQDHAHEPPLHTGAQMRSAISDRFVIRQLQRCAYLYRSISSRVIDGPRGAIIVEHARATEQSRLDAQILVPVGLRIVAERAEAP